MTLDDFPVETFIALSQLGELIFDVFENVRGGAGLCLGVCDEWKGSSGGQGVDVGVDLLGIKENLLERCGEIDRCVSGVVGLEHERIGVGGRREIVSQEGRRVQVGCCSGSIERHGCVVDAEREACSLFTYW